MSEQVSYPIVTGREPVYPCDLFERGQWVRCNSNWWSHDYSSMLRDGITHWRPLPVYSKPVEDIRGNGVLMALDEIRKMFPCFNDLMNDGDGDTGSYDGWIERAIRKHVDNDRIYLDRIDEIYSSGDKAAWDDFMNLVSQHGFRKAADIRIALDKFHVEIAKKNATK